LRTRTAIAFAHLVSISSNFLFTQAYVLAKTVQGGNRGQISGPHRDGLDPQANLY